MGRPVTTGISPKRGIRVPETEWAEITAAAAGQHTTVAALTREFYAWYLRTPGAKLPKRPAE